MKKFLFMCGTPRSGTTYLAGIIGRHPSIALGVERFKFHYACKTLSPELFDKSRFFDLRAEDTTERERIVLPRVSETYKKYDSCEFFGDKYPNIVRHLGWINERFGEPAFLFVLRHPVHVARSWSVRAGNERDHWPEKNDFYAGIDYWTDTLKRLSAAHSAGMNVIPIDYDLLVGENDEVASAHLAGIFDRLALPNSNEVRSMLLDSRRSGADVNLTAEEEDKVRGVLASAAWRGFMKRFVNEQFSTPRWSQTL